MPEISCAQFTDLLSRRSEHLDDEILKDLTPPSTIIGKVETGRFPAEDGTSHTFDKFNRVFPDMSVAWDDVKAGSCVGTPCNPSETKIGMGFTRDMYKLQQKSYATDLFCYDLIMSADRAKQQFAHTIEILRDATDLIISNRLRNEMFRIAGHHWLCMMGGLEPFTFTETGDMITVVPTGTLTAAHLPTSKMVVNMLRTRIDYQILSGALGKKVQGGPPPEIEVLSDYNTIWDLCQGDSTVADHWRFDRFDTASKEYYQYGWFAKVGNFMLNADLHPIRFEINPQGWLTRVFPYTNIAATQGIKGVPNDNYINAPVQATMIWHRRGMRSLGRDTTSINPMMPFAMRDFGGKWQFVMDNLTCGYSTVVDSVTGQTVQIPIAVDNSRRNKGKFISDFSFATQAQFPEYVEVFLHLREQPCIVGQAPCATPETYVIQDYNSANTPCPVV